MAKKAKDNAKIDLTVLGSKLKGHAVLELHDTVRGTYKRIEKDNLITNAYKYCMAANVMNGNALSGGNGMTLPIYAKALGGIMLFDGSLTESADNVHFPTDVHLVGYADRAQDTADAMRGSYNVSESGFVSGKRGYQSVWDFSTSQVNATIASLTLTNIKAVEKSSSCDPMKIANSSSNYPVATTGWDYHYHDGEYGYTLTISGGSIVIEKRNRHLPVISVADTTLGDSNEVEATYTVDISSDPIAITDANYWNYAGNGDFYGVYVVADNYNVESSLRVRVARLHTSNWTTFSYTATTELTLAGVVCGQGSTGCCVSGRYLYIQGYDNTGTADYYYIVNLDNTASIRKVKHGYRSQGGSTSGRLAGSLGGGVAALLIDTGLSNYDYRNLIAYPDGTHIESRFAGVYIPRGHSTKLAPSAYNTYGSSGTAVLCRSYAAYLGTICNLGSSVIKTAASTMKITYTLTDEGA